MSPLTVAKKNLTLCFSLPRSRYSQWSVLSCPKTTTEQYYSFASEHIETFPLFDISVFLQLLFNFFVISQFSMLMCFFLSEEQCCLKKSVIFASNLLQAVKRIPTVKRRYFWATLVGTKAELKKSCILAFALDSNPIVGGESGYNETESSATIKDMLFKCNLLLEESQKG